MSNTIEEGSGVESNDGQLLNDKECMKSLSRPTCSSSKIPKNRKHIFKKDAKSWRLKHSNYKIGNRKQMKRSKPLKKFKHPKKMCSNLNQVESNVSNNLESEIENPDNKNEESLKMINCNGGSDDVNRIVEPEIEQTDAKSSDLTLFDTDSSNDAYDICTINKKRKSSAINDETSKKKCTESTKTLDEPIKHDDSVKSPILVPSLQPWLKTFSAWSHNERIQAIDSLITQATSSEVRHMMKTIEPLFQRDFIALLPREIALTLLKYLSAKDLRVAAQTCRCWRMMCDDNLLWKEQCRRIGITSLSNNRYATCSSPYKTAYLHQYKIEKRWMTLPVDKPIVMKGHDDHVITCLQFFGNRILSGSDDTTLKVWSATTGRCIRTLSGHTGGVWSSQMVGRLVVSGSTDRTLKIWDATMGRCLQTLSGHTSTVRCMHMHGNVVVSGSRDATLRVWSLDTGRCLRVLVGHLAAVRCVQYDGKYVVSGAYDYFVKVWNPLTGECVHTLSGHTNRVYSLQFDGTHIVSGSLDTSIRVWDVESGQLKHTLVGHQSLTSGMELDNNILVSGNADSTVKVWDITTGLCIHTLSGANKHQSAVTCLQATKRFVITSSDDGTVKLWDLRTGEFIRNLVELGSGGSGGVIWRIKASQSKLICAVGSRNGTEETKLLVLDFEIPEVCFKCQH